jgi:hypothetical protein
LPAQTPDAALLDLYREASTKKPPNIVHFIDEKLLWLGKTLPRVTLKAGKREAFLSLVSRVLHRAFLEHSKAAAHTVSYVSEGLPEQEVAAFFASAAALYRLAPWEIFTCSGFLFRLQATSLGLSEALVHFEAFTSSHGAPLLILRLDLDEESDVDLEFIAREDAQESLQQELDAKQWELASDAAVPVVYYYQHNQATALSLSALRALRAALDAVSHFISRHRHLSLLPEVTPVTESLTPTWLAGAELQITGPHPDFDFTPYEPSERELDEAVEALGDLDEDDLD